jgi:hypothetical protein
MTNKDKNIATDPLLDDEGQSKAPEAPARIPPAVDQNTSATAPASDESQKAEPDAEPDQPDTPPQAPETPTPIATPDASPEPPIVADVKKNVSANEAKSKDIIAETKAILKKKPHTNFIIPLADGEAVGSFETVQINGYKLTIQKGVMVNIPVPVANILAEKYRIAMTAGQDKRIDRAPDVQDALS